MTPEKYQIRRQTILVVDDTPQNLSLMRDVLEDYYDVKLAPSGARALKILGSSVIDLVLLDVMMPEMSGYDVIRAIKANEKTRYIPVIFLTALTENEDEQVGLELGAADYVAKPFSPSLVLARIRTQLENKAVLNFLLNQQSLFDAEISRLDVTNKNRTLLIENLNIFKNNLLEKNAELTTRTEELAAAVQETKNLKQIADAANRSKSDFLANMTHEIRTPMTAIVGLIELALDREMSTTVRGYLDRIKFSADHLLKIITDVLDFSKIEAGRMDIDRFSFSIKCLVSKVTGLMSQKAESKQLTLIYSIHPDVPDFLVGDELRICQVLINYVSNAVKFTNQGQIEINVRVQNRTDNQVTLYFEVIDTGIGLSDAQQNQLFSEFGQIDSPGSLKYEGTGLGLAICKSLAEAMGGSVGVQSSYGGGSTFWFTACLEVSPASLDTPTAMANNLFGKRALVLGGESKSTLEVIEAIKSLGTEVLSISLCQKGIELLNTERGIHSQFDFVLIDLSALAVERVDIRTGLKNLNFSRTPHILLGTEDMRSELTDIAEEFGIYHVLTEPVTPILLETAMKQVLRANHQGLYGLTADGNSEENDFVQRFQCIRGARILLVEDDDINLEVMRELIQGAGFIVDTAINGQKAIECLESSASGGFVYDIVLMDLQMPLLDGFSAVRKSRLIPGLKKIPIVAMTASSTKTMVEQCFAAGFDDFVSKPAKPKVLWEMLIRWITPRDDTSPPFMGDETVIDKEAPETSTNDTSALAQISSLNLEHALLLMDNNQSLYLRTLHLFFITQSKVCDEIESLILESKIPDAARQAHTLRGQASYLGACELQKTAGALEDLLSKSPRTRVNKEKIEKALLDTRHQLSTLLASVSAAMPQW